VWIDSTSGIWPELTEVLRIDLVDIGATDETRRRVRAHWPVAVTITDIHRLRGHSAGSQLPHESFAELWNRAADPVAPLTGPRGATWEPISVEITRGR
jgi:hypothetical protein